MTERGQQVMPVKIEPEEGNEYPCWFSSGRRQGKCLGKLTFSDIRTFLYHPDTGIVAVCRNCLP